jgi:phage protein D
MAEQQTILPVKPYPGQDFYVPAFELYIKNRKFQLIQDVLSVTYTDSLTEMDSFDIVVNNWDPRAGAGLPGVFKYSDGPVFDPWQDAELWMGYYRGGQADFRRMLTGEITTSNVTFPAGGASTLTVRGLNLLHRFRTEPVSRPFINKKDSDIAKDLVDTIAAAIRKSVPNIRLEMDEDERQANLKREVAVPYLAMQNMYPILFLMQRARDIGYDLSGEEKAKGADKTVIFRFRPSHLVRRPTYELEWGKLLISFQPTLQTAAQVNEVVVRGWDPKAKAKFEEKATRADLNGQGVAQPDMIGVRESSLAQRVEITADRPVQTKQEAKDLALNTLRQMAQGLVEARGKTIGLPDLRAGCKVNIVGLGKRYSGTYLVKSTTHSIGESGYTTDFNCRMEAKTAPQGAQS